MDIKSSNNLTRCKDQAYSNFISTLVEEAVEEHEPGYGGTIFGARLDTDEVHMSDLFAFHHFEPGMQLESTDDFQTKNTSTLMNAFVHQGEYFS